MRYLLIFKFVFLDCDDMQIVEVMPFSKDVA